MKPRWMKILVASLMSICGFWGVACGAPSDQLNAVPPIAAPHHLSDDGSHFRSASGTPVLWLADTWWFCPSTLCPIEGSSDATIPSMFKALVDRRAEQGFNVVQIAFQGPAAPGMSSLGTLYAQSISEDDRTIIWQNARRYVQYANSRGLTVAIAASFHTGLDALSLDQLKLLWRDIVDNLTEFDVIWFIAGEYNLMPAADRLEKVNALGNYIRTVDPHHRLLSAHPADWTRRLPDLEQADWMDFIMIQAGHGALPPASVYQERKRRGIVVPVIEGECRYEGIHGRFKASHVRQCMIRAIQAGAVGFSYGAHGLWYPKQSATDHKFAEYGVAKPWWEAMDYPGAAAVAKTRRFFEAQRWWTMPARPDALLTGERIPEDQRALVRMQADERVLVWFPSELSSAVPYSLRGLKPGAVYEGQWMSGELNEADQPIAINPIVAEARLTSLPARPVGGDWFLLMQRASPAIKPTDN